MSDDVENVTLQLLELKLWYIQLVPQERSLRVAGFLQYQENTLRRYISSTIIERESAVCVMTNTRAFRLIGGMDLPTALCNGVPTELAEHFRKGFPANWKELVEDYMADHDKSHWAPDSDRFSETVLGTSVYDRTSLIPPRKSSLQIHGPMMTKSVRRSKAFRGDCTQTADRTRVPPASPCTEENRESTELPRRSPRFVHTGREELSQEKPEGSREEKRRSILRKSIAVVDEEKNGLSEEAPRPRRKSVLFKSPAKTAMTPEAATAPSEEDISDIINEAMQHPLVALEGWMFCYAPNPDVDHPAISITGMVYEEDSGVWEDVTTNEVIHVEGSTIVYTRSGSRYALGAFDDVVKFGLPASLAKTFAHGLPEDWKERLLDIYQKYVRPQLDESDDEEEPGQKTSKTPRCLFTPVRVSKPRKSLGNADKPPSRPVLAFSDDERESDEEASPVRPPKKIEENNTHRTKTNVKQANQVNTSHAAKKPTFSTKRLSTLDEHEEENRSTFDADGFRIPKGRASVGSRKSLSTAEAHQSYIPGVTAVEDVKTTRYGRLSHRPLAQWAGEGKVLDTNGDVIGVTGITTQTVLTVNRGYAPDLPAISRFHGFAGTPLRNTKQAQRGLHRPDPEPKVIRRSTEHKPNRGYDSEEEDETLERMKQLYDEESPIIKGSRNKKRIDSSSEEESSSEASSSSDEEPAPRKPQPKRAEQPKPKNTKKPAPKETRPKENATDKKKKPTTSKPAPVFAAPAPKKPKKQTAEEKAQYEKNLRLLQGSLKIISVRNEDDWKKVEKRLNGVFDAATCKKLAIEKGFYKSTQTQAESSNEPAVKITARQGTTAYNMQADKYIRNHMTTGGTADFFGKMAAEEEDKEESLDLDDSMLELMVTPKLDKNSKKSDASSTSRRGGKNEVLKMIENDQTGKRSRRRSSSPQLPGTAERERNQRYVSHRINSTINSTLLNGTSLNYSKR